MQQQAPPSGLQAAGYELTQVRQFTVLLQNRVGCLQTLVRLLELAPNKIAGLAVEESADVALVRVLCTHPDKARHLLEKNQMPFTESDLLAVRLPAQSHTPLGDLCAALLQAEINVHYVYPLLTSGPAALALCVEDPVLAAKMLIKENFTILSQNDLREGK